MRDSAYATETKFAEFNLNNLSIVNHMTNHKITNFYSILSEVIEEDEIKEIVKTAAYTPTQVRRLLRERETEICDKAGNENKRLIELRRDLADKNQQISKLLKVERPTTRTIEQIEKLIEQQQAPAEIQAQKSANRSLIVVCAAVLLLLGIFGLLPWNGLVPLPAIVLFLFGLVICFLFLHRKQIRKYANEKELFEKEKANSSAEIEKLLTEKKELAEWEQRKAEYERESAVDLLREECEKLGGAIKEILTTEIRGEIRLKVNERVDPSYLPQLKVYQHNGLSETIDLSHAVETESQRKLAFLLEQIPGGSIGIAGPRGSGKSTLIKKYCEPDSKSPSQGETISVLAAAPVEYDARDFLLHLYGSVCRSVLQKHYSTGDIPAKTFHETSPYSLNFLETVAYNNHKMTTGGAILIVLSLISAFTLWKFDVAPAFNAAFSGELWKWGIPLLVVGYFANHFSREFIKQPRSISHIIARYNFPVSVAEYEAAAAAQIKQWQHDANELRQTPADEPNYVKLRVAGKELERKLAEYESNKKHNSLPAEARKALMLLEEIKFQQSISTGASGILKIPVGFEAGISRTTTTTQIIMSIPEIVNALTDFLRYLTADGKRRVIVGIDELDKIETDEQAQRFLNQIKSIFGIRHCFYLITCSSLQT